MRELIGVKVKLNIEGKQRITTTSQQPNLNLIGWDQLHEQTML